MSAPVPLIRQRPFAQVISVLSELGEDPSRVLPRYGLPEWHHGEAEEMIPIFDFIKSFEVGARATGSEFFSLLVAERLDLSDFGNYGTGICKSLNVYDAMRNTCILSPKEATTVHFWLEECPNGVLFCRKQFYSTPEIEHALSLLETYILELLSSVVQLGAGPDWQPSKIFVSMEKKYFPKGWPNYFDADVRFEAPYSAIFVPNSVLALPIGTSPRKLDTDSYFALELSSVDSDLAIGIHELMKSHLRRGLKDHTKRSAVAEFAGLSQRTLQRRLAESSTSFQKVLDQARYEAALELIADPTNRVADISEYIGYENPQHFIRAFKRWSGLTPNRYRKSKAPSN